MLLASRQSYELLSKFGVFAREICDKCGAVLGAVRFGVEKTVCIQSETKDLQARKTPLSTIPLTPLFPGLETAYDENGGVRA